jgi:tetratricopeptide (TPR) repeat protein/chloramphenicol 3-O-phosphotransferase
VTPETAGGGSRLVGREFELEQLREALARAGETRKAQLVTILGPPGIGKSSLAAALLAEAASSSTVCLAGGCAEYGEELPLAPLRRAFLWAGVDSAETAAARLPPSADRDRVADALGGLFEGTAEDAATLRWSIRRALEGLAQNGTVQLVLDDIHRADSFLLDLIEYLGGVRTAPLAIVCFARPELLERRADWGETDRHAFTIGLAPLSGPETNELIDSVGGAPAASRQRLIDGSGGNPLFLEQLLALARTTGGVSAAPTIESLIAARLELLTERERHALGRAAVAGFSFDRSLLGKADPELDTRVLELLVPKAVLEAEGDGFRFRHAVVHEVAYLQTAPDVRAELHERLAESAREPVDRLFHLERAARQRAEAIGDAERMRAVSTRAAESLFELALTAAARGALQTAVDLLERAAGLLEAHDPRRAEVLVELGRALTGARRPDEARHALNQALELGDERVRIHAELALHRLDSTAPRADPGWSAATAARIEALATVLRQAGDDRGLAHAWSLLSELLLTGGEARAALGLARSAHERALQVGDAQLTARCASAVRSALVEGPTPVDEVVRELEQELKAPRPIGDEVALLCRLATAEAMRGDQREALEHVDRAARLAAEGELESADQHAWHGRVALAVGDPETAERELRLAVAAVTGPARATPAALTGLAQLGLDRIDEADRSADVARTSAAADDVYAQLQWRAVAAAVRSRQNRDDEAVALARAGLSFVERTDLVAAIGHGELAVAVALLAAGESEKASAAAERALEQYRAKGDRSSIARAQWLLEQVAAEPRSERV